MNYLVRSLKIACLVLLTAFPCALAAQTYKIGADNSTQPQQPAKPEETPGQGLGWGSNIQNARLARGAEMALQHGDYAQAYDLAHRAASTAPNDPQLWFLLGYAARLTGRYQQSVDAYKRGISLKPSSLDGLSGLAQTYAVTGRSDDAENLLKQTLAADPRRYNDALVLGDLYMKGGDYTSALDWLNRSDHAHADARPELLMALCYEHLNRMDMASRYLDAAKRKAPDNPDVERSLAGYYRETGKYADAITALKSIHSPRPDVVAELAYTYQLDGKLNESARYYSQAANSVPKDMSLQLAAAQAQVAAGSLAEADPFLQRAADIDPNYYRLHAIRGEIARMKDQGPDAVREYNAAIAALPATPAEGPLYGIQLHMDLMDLYKSQRNQDGAHHQLEIAQEQIRRVNEQGVPRAPFMRLRALIKMNTGDLDGALADVKTALAVDSHDPNGLQLNGDILMKMGRTEDAINVYKSILAIDPANRFALTSLGYASRAAGHDDAAEKYFLRLAQVDPSLYVPYLALGDLYTARHQYSKANSAYDKAYHLQPKNALILAGGINAAIEAHNLPLGGTWLGRATVDSNQEPQFLREKERYLSFKGDYQGSADVAQEALKVLPTDRDVVVYLGYDELHLEKWDDLLALTQKNLDVFPKEPDIPLLMGYVHKHQGKSEEAREDFTETLHRDPTVVTAYVNRGYMLNDLHKPDLAANDFNEALKREPDNSEARLGLAYSDLDLHKPQAAIRQADLAEKLMGDNKNVHVIRATAYGREDMLSKAAEEYRAALKFTPDDGSLHLGLGGTLFSERKYREAIEELEAAEKYSPEDAQVYAMMARAYASLDERDQTMRYVHLAEQKAQAQPDAPNSLESSVSNVYIATGEALSTLGDQSGAMDRFRRALTVPRSNRVSVRLAIAQVMAQQGHQDDSEREIALALMEAESGDTAPPTGPQYIMAADVFRSMHDFQLSQNYLERAKAAGAPDAEVRIGLANNYLALGDTTRANAELDAVRTTAGSAPDYQFLLAKANVYRQQHHNAEALTSFAQASNAGGDDQSVATSLMQTGADEGLRVTPAVSVLSDFSVNPVFEDTTVYVLDSKLDAPFAVPGNVTSLLPPPRSSLQTQETGAFHLHYGRIPTPSGFFQIRNQRGQISVPATNSIVNRNTTDWTWNIGLNPTVNLGNNVITFDGGFQTTVRRDSESPVQMNQNLFRVFTYVNTSSFFNALSVSGYILRESGPFTESNLHSRNLTAAIDFRVGAPWGKTALVTGWGSSDQLFTPMNFEDYVTSSYIGIDRHFSQRLDVRAMVEDLRAWRKVGGNSGIAQNLRPAGTVNFALNKSWNLQFSSAYSNNRGFHAYDATQNGFAVSYARPFRRKFNDDSGTVMLQYPIRFSAGLQEETFFNFQGGQNQQLRPYFQVSLF